MSNTTRPDENPPEPGVNILLVDDQPANLLALEAALADLGQNLIKASSGGEALRCLLAADFAVILLDVQMTGLDGFETARLIRGRGRSRSTPIIFLTAYDSRDFPAEQAYALGAVDFLVKPLNPTVLRAKVAVFVELSRKTNQVERQAEQLRRVQQERAERRALAQYVVAGLLAESATLREAVPKVLRATCEGLGWDVAVLWTVDREGGVLRCADFWHGSGVEVTAFVEGSRSQPLATGIGLPGRVWAEGEPAWIADVTCDANFPRAEAAARAGLRGACACPLRRGQEVLGVLECFSRTARPPEEDLLRGLAAIGSQVGQFLERRRTEKELRRSEARKAAILEAALDAIVTIDHEGLVIEFNPAAERMFGRARADVVGQEMARLIVPPSLRSQHSQGLTHYLATGEGPVLGQRLEMPALRADGTEFPVELAITRIAAEPPLFTAYLRDLTAVKRAEQTLAERARLAEYGAAVGVALTQSGSLGDMLGRCTEATVRHLDAAFARVWTLNDTGDVLELQASAGLYVHLNGPHSRVPVGQFKIGLIAQERKPHLTNHVIGDPLVGEQHWARREGMVAFAGFPLVIEDRLVGVIALFARRALTAATLQALASVADEIAVGIDRKRAEDAERKQREWLHVTLSSVGDGVIATDAEGRITFMNSVAESLTGWDRHEASGRPLEDVFRIIGEETRQPVETPVRLVIEQGVIAGLANHTVLISRDGTECPIADSAAPIRSGGGAIQGVVLVFRDVRAAREAERERERLDRHVRLLLDSTGEGLYGVDLKGHCTFANRAAADLLGYRPEQLLGRNMHELIHHSRPDGSPCPQTECRIYRALDDLQGCRVDDEVFWRRDGTAFPVEYASHPIFEDGVCRGCVVSFNDVTARKEASARLRHAEAWLRRMIESVTDHAIFSVGLDGRVTTWNAGAERVFGHPEGEILGHTADVLFTPTDRADGVPEQELRRAAEAGQAADERWHVRRDGSRFFASGVVTPLRDDAGNLHGFTKVARDITQRKEMEEALKEADRRKDNFLALLGHELRNPLAAVRNAVALLGHSGMNGAAFGQARDTIGRQVTHLTRLVDELLDASRIANGKIQLKRERLDLCQLVRAAAEDHRPAVEASGLTLAVEVPLGPVWVDGDGVRLAQVVSNLVHNATKFTDAGGRVAVRMATETDRRAVTVTVRDTGLGMEASLLDHLFEPFAQGDRSLDRSRGGLGLGLALVKGLVELHGGQVRAASAGLGRGSEFRFWLPLAAEPGIPAKAQQSPQRPSRGLRILIVEDNRDAADSLRLVLELSGGHTVAVAYSGSAGVELAGTFRPAVVLCDLGLPGMSGFEVARTLRSDPVTASARLIAVSGYGQEEDHRKAREAGFDAALVKPVEPAELQRLLAERPP